MPFIVIDRTNALGPLRTVEFATEPEADAAARELLNANPGNEVLTAHLVKRYSAQVSVTVQEAEALPVEEPAQ